MDDTSATPPPPPRTLAGALRRPLYALGVLLVVWLVFGELAPRLIFGRSTEQPVSTTDVLAMAQHIKALETRIEALEARPAEAPPPPPPPAPPPEDTLAGWRADVEQKLAALEATRDAPPPALDTTRLEALEARLNNQQAAFATIQLQADEKLALQTAFYQLHQQIYSGEPYARALEALTGLMAGREDVREDTATLAAQADHGIATPQALRERFVALIPGALAAGKGDGLAAKLPALVRIRKVGEPEGTNDESIIARAESRLARAELAQAAAELQALSEPAAAVFAPWKAQLEARQAVLQALQKVQLSLHKSALPEAAPAAPAP
jgi:hypothetical protein